MNTNSTAPRHKVRPSLALGLIVAGLLGASAGSASAFRDDDGPSRAERMAARAQGSDRHLQMLNDEIAERAALIAVAEGSDAHLENLNDEIAERAALIAQAEGSDVHLENLNDEIASRSSTSVVN